MKSFRISRNLAEYHGISWNLAESHGISRNLVESRGFSQNLEESRRILRNLMKYHGISQNPQNLADSRRFGTSFGVPLEILILGALEII